MRNIDERIENLPNVAICRVEKWNVPRPQGSNPNFLSLARHRDVIAHGRLRRLRMRLERQNEANRQFVFAEHALVSRMCFDTNDVIGRRLLGEG